MDKRKLDPWLVATDMCLAAYLCGMDMGYTGHYILLVGFDAKQQVGWVPVGLGVSGCGSACMHGAL